MNAVRPIPYRPERTVHFLAWRSEAPFTNAALSEAETFDQAVAACMPAPHKSRIAILRIDEGKAEQHLHVYAVKLPSKPVWRRDPVTRVPYADREPYADLIFAVPVHAFQPVEPYDAFRDDPVGRDLMLVEGGR